MAEVIVALDLPGGSEALRLLDRLPEARWVKVGSILMTREGPDLVRVLVDRGLRVFLDLKWHDIPNTVAEAVSRPRELGVSMATVHTLGGAAMMEAAAAVAAGGRLGLVGVTVLTSHDAASYGRAVGRARGGPRRREVERLSSEAVRSGLAGVVCSPREVAAVRRRVGPEPWIVVPGIRGGADARGRPGPRGDCRRRPSRPERPTSSSDGRSSRRRIPSAAFRGFLEEAQCIGS